MSTPPLARLGNLFFHHRNWLFPVVLFGLLLGLRPVYIGGDEGTDRWFDVAGLLIALTGQVLRVAVIGYAYIIRGGRNAHIYAEDLVTEGFFAHSRNPLYLGNILVLVGLFVLHGNPVVLGVGIPLFVLAYAAIVAAEEAFLRGKFGAAYDAYTRDVPRWWPNLRGLRESTAGMRFNWRRAVVKEYGSTFAWTSGAILVLVLQTLAYHQYEERAGFLGALWVLLGLLVATWGTVRWLKKSRRLRDVPVNADSVTTA